MLDLLSRFASELGHLHAYDALTIATIALLEGILSVDNALVLAIMVRPLPKAQQKRALLYGIVGAFVFRFVALVFATYLMHMSAFKLIGGAYLIYLGMRHMLFATREEAYEPSEASARSFWRTVFMVEMTDIVFSIDSITAAVAMTEKLSIVWIGGILGILSLRVAAGFFIRILEKLPKLEDLAYQLVFFVGTKLTLEGFHIEVEPSTFWMTMGVITAIGGAIVYRDHTERRRDSEYEGKLLNDFASGALDWQELLRRSHVPSRVLRAMHDAGYLSIKSPKTTD